MNGVFRLLADGTNQRGLAVAQVQGGKMVHPDMPDEVALECPAWAIAPLLRRFGAAFAPEMAATLLSPPLDLRVNPIKSTRAAMLHELKSLGLRAEATKLAPNGIRLRERLSLDEAVARIEAEMDAILVGEGLAELRYDVVRPA